MTVSRFYAGFALLTLASCAQGSSVYVPSASQASGTSSPTYVSTGYISQGYATPRYLPVGPAAQVMPPRYIPVGPTAQAIQPRYIPGGTLPDYAATSRGAVTSVPRIEQTYAAPAPMVQTYAVPAAVVQNTPSYIAQSVPSLDVTPVYEPAPVYGMTPAINAASARYLPAEPAMAAPAPAVVAMAPAPTPVATVSRAAAPATYTPVAPAAIQPRPASARAQVAAFGKDRPTSAPRRFQAIGGTRVADVSPPKRPFPVRKPITRVPGMQVTTAEPFSIQTSPSGKPYYLGSTPPAIEYHIPHIPQEEPLWCWAAAAQQAIGWVNKGRAPAQCAIVALAHGLNVQECCGDREGICAKTGEIPAIASLVKRFGGEARELATVPRDPQKIYDILRGGDTVLIRLRPAPHDEAVGIRHMIVVRGIEWLRLPNNQLQATLLYNDPLGAGERAVNFDEIEGFFEQALVVSRR